MCGGKKTLNSVHSHKVKLPNLITAKEMTFQNHLQNIKNIFW